MKILPTTLGLSLLLATGLSAQNADPFVRAANPLPQQSEESRLPKFVSVRFEVFSMPFADAAALMRQNGPDDDEKTYATIVAALNNATVKQEILQICRARSGQRGTNEAISEQIYPTEYLPTSLQAPENVPAPQNGQPQPAPQPARSVTAPAERFPAPCPSAFETRNTGLSVEIEPTIGENDDIIDLRIEPNLVLPSNRSRWGKDEATVEMPEYESQRLTTSVTLRSGKPQLLGTFNRAPNSKIDPEAPTRVWFAFVTGSVGTVRK